MEGHGIQPIGVCACGRRILAEEAVDRAPIARTITITGSNAKVIRVLLGLLREGIPDAPQGGVG